MLAHDSSFMFGVPGNSDNLELSMEGLRELLSQVEAELHRSEVYCRALGILEENASESKSAQFLLKAVSREAIRLALRQVMRQAAPIAQASSSAIQTTTPAFTAIQESTPATQMEVAPPPPPPTRRGKKTQEQIRAEEFEYRQDCFRRLGEQIRQARQARSMSLEELHSRTFVPLHQLQALEAGCGPHLPEDVYVRGFVLRIAKALSVESAKLLGLLPTSDPAKGIIPSWQRPKPKSSITIGGVSLKPAHLYVGYAALAAGGCAWLSHQATVANPGAVGGTSSPQQVGAKAQSELNQKANPDASVSVAPPERF